MNHKTAFIFGCAVILFAHCAYADVVSSYVMYNPEMEKQVICYGTSHLIQYSYAQQMEELKKYIEACRSPLLILNGMLPYREGLINYKKAESSQFHDAYWNTLKSVTFQDSFLANLSLYYSHHFCPSRTFINIDTRFVRLYLGTYFYNKSIDSACWNYQDRLKQYNTVYLPLSFRKKKFEELSLESLLWLYDYGVNSLEHPYVPSQVFDIYKGHLIALKKQKETIKSHLLMNFSEEEAGKPLAQLIYEVQKEERIRYIQNVMNIFSSEPFLNSLDINALYHIYTTSCKKIIFFAPQCDLETVVSWLQELGWETKRGKDTSNSGTAIPICEFEAISE